MPSLVERRQFAFSRYQERSSPAHLADCFLCLWEQVIFGSGDYVHRVLPDACVDIVFINEAPPVVVGPWTDPFLVRFPSGTRIVGARLQPGRAAGILGIPAAELLNRSVPLRDLWSTRGARFRLEFDEQTVSSHPALEAALARAITSATPPDAAIMTSIRWLARHPGATVEQLSRSIGISHRQLQRRFSVALGYGPKMFQSVLRFQRLLSCARRQIGRVRLADLAAVAGYADQAHMTREVQRFAGCAPTAALSSADSTLKMSDLFKTDHLTSD